VRITLIAAVGSGGVIGRDGDLPWRLPADLRHFKRTTLGHPILMGRKTFDSIGKPLPGRRNLVLSRDPDALPEGVEGVGSVEEALSRVEGEDELFVIGGAEIYRLLLERADRLVITEVEGEFRGDTFFPEIDLDHWHEVERTRCEPDEKNPHPHAFVIWEKVPTLHG